ncbi:23S rRNA (guanine(745)-N(1))-methyltransferase [Endothiovibrio diazotrophicus]
MPPDHPLWRCPLCAQPLHGDDDGLHCDVGHRFDRAREGYVNLLPAHHKRSHDPGDGKAMVRSRREFLDRGHYRPLARRLAELSEAAYRQRQGESFRLLDSGCGEGHYIGQIAETLGAPLRRDLHLGGSDIAKEAVRLAAKRHRAVHFAVASSHALPIADARLDLVLCVFAPHHPEELCRVLKPGGRFLHVTPAPHHLYALRQQVYDTPTPHTPAATGIAGLQHLERQELRYPLLLDQPGDPARLLAMTPYYWHANEATQHRIAVLDRLETEAHFFIDLHGRP